MNKSIGGVVMNFAVAGYLLATGIMGFADGLEARNSEIRQAVVALFGRGDLTNALVVIFSILAIVAGVLLLLRFFNVEVPMVDLLLVILAIVWLVFIIMIDIIEPIQGSFDFVPWLKSISTHLIVLGGIASATNRFGGR